MAWIIGSVFLALIVLSALWNRDDLKRLQHLKNKRRFSGKRLPADEQKELDRLQVKYPWY